jgi:hypothetical protein
VEGADYNNLLNPHVHFTYEDHFLRMIVPLRHTFNDLAAAFVSEGNRRMASEVLKHALENLYPYHLPPSYTNLQAAELLLTLSETASAARLCEAVFNSYKPRVEAVLNRGGKPSNLDRYLLQRAAELLAVAGDDSYLKSWSRLDEN